MALGEGAGRRGSGYVSRGEGAGGSFGQGGFGRGYVGGSTQDKRERRFETNGVADLGGMYEHPARFGGDFDVAFLRLDVGDDFTGSDGPAVGDTPLDNDEFFTVDVAARDEQLLHDDLSLRGLAAVITPVRGQHAGFGRSIPASVPLGGVRWE